MAAPLALPLLPVEGVEEPSSFHSALRHSHHSLHTTKPANNAKKWCVVLLPFVLGTVSTALYVLPPLGAGVSQ